MTGLLKCSRYPTRGSLYFLLFILASTAATTMPVTARANDVAIDAIINHPAVAAARARVCQSASQYDLAVARERPQVDFSLRGGTSLKSRFERRDSNSPHSRRFDDEDVDAVIGINQLLYDWGGVDASKRVALSEQAGNRISLSLEIDRVAADIIDLGIKLSEQQQRFDLFTQYKQDLAPHIRRIEAGVAVGVLRLSDLRSIKVIELDADIAITLAERQIGLLKNELGQRFGLDIENLAGLLATFRYRLPPVAPVIDSTNSREVMRIDQQIIATQHEITRLKSERRPRLTTNIDTTLFDVDSYSQEYEITGELQLTMPLNDGGSNQARRDEQDWRRRGLTNERENTIRQHRNVSETTRRNIERARDSIQSNEEKITALNDRLAEALARQGETSGDVLSISSVQEQLVSIHSEQISLSHQVELGLLQGIFFADALGDLLDLPHGGPKC